MDGPAVDSKVPFGLRRGQVVHISELDASSRGLRCNCMCPCCGDRLVAKLGEVRVHHFSHQSDGACVGNVESALHLFAKEVFQRHRRFRVPAVRIAGELASYEVAPATYANYSSASVEEHMSGVVPDVTLEREAPHPSFLVEVAVTHFADDAKRDKLKGIGLPCVEVDLSAYSHSFDDFDREGIERLLVYGDGPEKTWLHMPDEERWLREIRERESADFAARRARELAESRLREERERRLEKDREMVRTEEHRRDEARGKLLNGISELHSPERMAEERKRWAAELHAHPVWVQNRVELGVSTDNIPYWLDVVVEDFLEELFVCHRTVWQSELFLRWVFRNQDDEGDASIHVMSAATGLLVRDQELRDGLGKLLCYDLTFGFEANRRGFSLSHPVSAYFERLAELGLLRRMDGAEGKAARFYARAMRRVPIPPTEYNNPRYLPRNGGVLDSVTGKLIHLG